MAVATGSSERLHLDAFDGIPEAAPAATAQDHPSLNRRERSSLLKNRMREICTSGSVRGGDGNIPAYSANYPKPRAGRRPPTPPQPAARPAAPAATPQPGDAERRPSRTPSRRSRDDIDPAPTAPAWPGAPKPNGRQSPTAAVAPASPAPGRPFGPQIIT